MNTNASPSKHPMTGTLQLLNIPVVISPDLSRDDTSSKLCVILYGDTDGILDELSLVQQLITDENGLQGFRATRRGDVITCTLCPAKKAPNKPSAFLRVSVTYGTFALGEEDYRPSAFQCMFMEVGSTLPKS